MTGKQEEETRRVGGERDYWSPVVSANVAIVGSEDAQNPTNPNALAAPNPMLI